MLSRHSNGLYIWMKSEFAKLPFKTLELKAVKAVPLYKLSLSHSLTVPPALFSDTFE